MSYAKDLVAQLTKRTPLELTWELEEALNEALQADFELSETELLAWHVCTVAHCDGIAEVLENQPESIPIAAKFARDHGLLETAGTLEKVVQGVGADEPVAMSMKIRGKTIPVDLPDMKWGAADLLLSLVDEDLDTAILDFVAANVKEFTLPPPTSVLKRAKKKKKVADQVAQKSAAQLLRELIAHKSPRLRCTRSQADGSFSANQTIEVPVAHSAESVMTSQRRAGLQKQYGGAATPLLELLAGHDGASLFCVGGQAALYLLPSAHWAEHMESVMSWAQEVTWQDDPDEIPRYLSSAIPFAYIPGDSERWLLITEGAHAGKVMLSDSDVIEDAPRFDSVAEFIGALMMDASRILGCGGYICYDENGQSAGGGEGCYYPQKYLFSS
jgi:hypothetical protein